MPTETTNDRRTGYRTGRPSLESLPAFSPVASRLLALALDPNVSMKAMEELIAMDAALAADVLRLTNSPLYAPRSPVSSLLRAMALLGHQAVVGMVLTVALRNFAKVASNAPTFRQCWRHNLACAIIANELAATEWMDRDVAYSMGLLHDSGRLAMLAASPVSYNRLLQISACSNTEMMEMERELFEMDHCEAGYFLAVKWDLPMDYCNAMLRHHEPPAEAERTPRQPVTIIHLACELAAMAGFAAWGPPREWDTTELQATLPKVGREILDAGELIPRVAAGINALECRLLL